MLAECVGIVEAAVVGRPDARWREVPVVGAVREAESNVGAESGVALTIRSCA